MQCVLYITSLKGMILVELIMEPQNENTIHYIQLATNMICKLNDDQNATANLIMEKVTNVTEIAEECNA